jgi:ATP-binding cassette subfamily F protein uup
MSSLISANEIDVRYNEQVVLTKASLSIAEEGRVGLVGRNGTGKSTFLRILNGEQTPDSGTVVRKRGLIMGYLPQSFALDEESTVFEQIQNGAQVVRDLITEFESLPAESSRHEEIESQIAHLDGWNLESRINTAMSQLRVPAGDRRIHTLSGGEKRRVAICRAIVARPDLLVLDEPTNHLDPDSIEWLCDYLKEYSGAFLVVTHDRYFLDRVTSTIVELANGQFYTYDGNYTDYLLAKAERQATDEMVEKKRQSFIKRELEWVRRGPPARTTKSKSRLDRFFEIEGQKAPEAELDMELVIPPPPPIGNRIVDLLNLGMTVGDKQLFSGLNFTFEKGMRLGVAGQNGLGKTTLLRLIIGELKPTEGSVKTGSLTEFNYIDQARLRLNEDNTVINEISDGSEFVVWGNGRISLRAYLKRFLFTDDRVNTQVKFLSGGERSRLLLARVLKRGGNFLILDEPTNDLDLATLRVLEEALISFPGCVLVVSHDRYFLDRVCTGILGFEGNSNIHYSPGDYSYYIEKLRSRKAAAARPGQASVPKKQTPAQAVATPKRSKLSWKEARELEGMEDQIYQTEAEVARIEKLFVLPDFHKQYGERTGELLAEIEAGKKKIAELYARWEKLEEMSGVSV